MKGSDLEIGKKAKILEFIEDEYAVRFMELGLSPGNTIELLRVAPFEGAFYILTDHGSFALRKDELDHILIA